jgi:predicted transcriptional regulator
VSGSLHQAATDRNAGGMYDQTTQGLSRFVEDILARAGARCASDSQYERELRESIERGLADADAGRLIPVDELMREFGIEEQ